MSERWTDFFEQRVEDGEEAGFLPVAPPAEIAQRFVALSDGLSFRSAVGYTDMHVQRVRELLLSFAAEQLGVPPRPRRALDSAPSAAPPSDVASPPPPPPPDLHRPSEGRRRSRAAARRGLASAVAALAQPTPRMVLAVATASMASSA